MGCMGGMGRIGDIKRNFDYKVKKSLKNNTMSLRYIKIDDYRQREKFVSEVQVLYIHSENIVYFAYIMTQYVG